MFNKCRKLREIKGINKFRTDKVNDMRGIFNECNELKTLDLSNFNTINVIDLSIMFQECFELEYVDISSFNLINAKNIEWMFNKCYKLKEIKGINILKNIKNIDKIGIFDDCPNLKNLSNYFDNRPKNIEKKQIKIIFRSTDQIIKNHSVICYTTDIFENIKEKVFLDYPRFKYKECHFLSEGNIINERVSLAENRIKNGSVIIISDIE